MAIEQLKTVLKIVPMHGEIHSGDTGIIRQSALLTSWTLIDVLGHGDEAAELADAVHLYMNNSEILPPIDTILDLHERFRGSRGMVASNILLNMEDKSAIFCGIGNIVTRFFGATNRQMVNRDGVVGYRMVNPISSQIDIHPGDTLLMHSDGISSRLLPKTMSLIPTLSSQHIVEHIFKHYARETDDASALVVRI